MHLGEIAQHFSRNLQAVLKDIKAVCPTKNPKHFE
jgi:hypothetical protein